MMHIATKLRFSPQAYVFLREFILGSNATGLVNGTDVVGGEVVALGADVLPGNTVIILRVGYYGVFDCSPRTHTCFLE